MPGWSSEDRKSLSAFTDATRPLTWSNLPTRVEVDLRMAAAAMAAATTTGPSPATPGLGSSPVCPQEKTPRQKPKTYSTDFVPMED